MAEGIPARLSPGEGRKFGLTVGIAFLVLGGISRWRGHDVAPTVFWVLGGGLTLSGLLFPVRLGPVYRAWMGMAHLLSRITTPLFMGVVYFLVVTPMGIIMRLLGKNPLVHRPNDGSYWIMREPRADQADSMRHQF